MKKTFLAVSVLLLLVSSASAEWVNGYTRKDGKYVQGYQRSERNSTKTDNYGPSENSYEKTNPYSRDSDRDGTPNYRDRDDNNDGRSDDSRNSYKSLYR